MLVTSETKVNYPTLPAGFGHRHHSGLGLKVAKRFPATRAIAEFGPDRRHQGPAVSARQRLGNRSGNGGTLVAAIWAELGDGAGRWESFRHLQAEAGVVPVTKASGKSRVVHFRFACNKHLRYLLYWFSFVSLNHSEWAKIYYRQQRAQGHNHPQALRALGAKWLKIIFVMWRDHKAYDEKLHLANIALQKMRQAAA